MTSAYFCFSYSLTSPTSCSSSSLHSCHTGSDGHALAPLHAVSPAFSAPSSLFLLAKLYLTTHLAPMPFSRKDFLILLSYVPTPLHFHTSSTYHILLSQLFCFHCSVFHTWTCSEKLGPSATLALNLGPSPYYSNDLKQVTLFL